MENITRKRLDRRGFLKSMGAGSAAGGTLFWAAAPVFSQDGKQQFLATVGKDPRLIVHNVKPGVVETPVELLRADRFTPKEVLFVRSNQVLPGALTLEPYPSQDWRLEISGLVNETRTVEIADLAGYEQTEVEAVLQCSGNGRSFYERSAKARGTQWRRGGMGNLRWKGVLLRDLLKILGLEIDPAARFLTAEGKDPPASPTGADFEQSVPLADVLDTALLATGMNGEPIPAIHGGPLRLVLPGYYGTMNVKWLSRLRLEPGPSQNRNHAKRYRTFVDPVEPGGARPVTAEATVPTWRQKIKSIIWNPTDGETLEPGPIEVGGVAWNDGRTGIDAVEVSVDRGESWRGADLETTSGPYGWRLWSQVVELSKGPNEVWARAIDVFGRGQPSDGAVHWNPSGYEWYGVDRVSVTLK